MDNSACTEDSAGAYFTDQDYDNLRRDQQFIAHKYDGGLKRLTLKLAPGIIVKEEEEEGSYQFVDQYNQWDTTPSAPVADNDMESSHSFRPNHLHMN